jgi:site-specific DNA-methyltransferase (adenine-specific)
MSWSVVESDVVEAVGRMPPESFQMIHADPPYFRVLAEGWDRQWRDREAFLRWMCEVMEAFGRALARNGTLCVWASNEMTAAIEDRVVRPYFDVVSSIVWDKGEHWALKKHEFLRLRGWVNRTERCIMAQHLDDGYVAACELLSREVFCPLVDYFREALRRASMSLAQVDEHLGTNGMAGHYFTANQWALPTVGAYRSLQDLLGDALGRDYDGLSRQKDQLQSIFYARRQDLENLRRPFFATRERFSNVWDYPPTERAPNRHMAEKPLAMMRDIVRASTRPGDLVLDAFAGSGSMSAACIDEGRNVVAVESSGEWCAATARRAARHDSKGGKIYRVPMAKIRGPLFGG